MVDAHLRRLVRGLDGLLLAWLFRLDELYGNIYMVERGAEGWQAKFPDAGSLPWPVLLLLGSHSRKHIITPGNFRRAELVKSLNDTVSRIKWAWLFRKETGDFSKPLLKRDLLHCHSRTPPTIEAFCRRLKEVGLEAGKKLTLEGGCKEAQKPAYMKFALRWLREKDYRVALSDKDGVFAMMPNVSFAECVSEELKKSFYQATSGLSIEVIFKHVKVTLLRLCKKLSEIDEKWGKEVRRYALSACEKQLLSPLKCTVKTHKSPVKVRLIHSSVNNVFNGLSEVVNRLLHPKLASLEHLVQSSDGATSLLRKTFINEKGCLIKLDVKDFYLSGDQSFIAKTVAGSFDDSQVSAFMQEALSCILDNQYVRNDFGDGVIDIYKVVRGSGIGMKHAGALSDWLLYLVLERWLLSSEWSRKIRRYMRFRDDILMVVATPSDGRRLVQEMTKKAEEIFILEVERASMVWVPFLDLEVFKPAGTGERLVGYHPHIKETARHIPLGSWSHHPESVHMSWPVAEMARMHARSSELHFSKLYRGIKIDRFASFFMRSDVLQKCRSWKAPLPSNGAEVALRSSTLDKCLDAAKQHRVIHVVLPFRAGIQCVVQSLKRLLKNWEALLASEGMLIMFRLSLKRGGRPLHSYF